MTVKKLRIAMHWSSKHDFDLAALYKTKNDQKGLVYFGEQGNLNGPPFMQLSGDAGVGDKVDAGGNEEVLMVTKLDDMAEVHLIVWDWGAVKEGKKARFKDSNVDVQVTDDKGNSNKVILDSGDTGNVLFLAKIDNSDPIGAKLSNESVVGTLKGMQNSNQLWDIIGHAAAA